MITYIGLAMVTLVVQVILHKNIKYNHDGSVFSYAAMLGVFSVIWPITLFLICIGLIIGLVKRG